MIGLLNNLKLLPVLFLVFNGVCAASGQTVITNIAAIRDLSPEEAAEALPVKIEGQVLWNHSGVDGFFLYGDGLGIYVSAEGRMLAFGYFPIGEMVRIEGVTSPGRFSPCIFIKHIESIGMKPLPEAEPFYLGKMYSTQRDCDWIQLAGRIESMSVHRETPGVIELDLEHNGHLLNVQIPLSVGAEEKVRELMFCRVQFRAVTGTLYNMKRQMLGRTFFVSSADAFEIIDDFVPTEGIQFKPIHELVRSGEKPRYLIGSYGLVTHVDGAHIYLRGEEACMKVSVAGNSNVQVGDTVEVEGFAVLRPLGPEFLARAVRTLEHQATPQPVAFPLNEELREKWELWPDTRLNMELVRADVQLVDISETFGLSTGRGEQILLCRQGNYLFETRIPAEMELDKRVKPGAQLQLTGICNLALSTERKFKVFVDGFWIQARNADDIKVILPAPWWTTRTLVGLLVIVLGIAGLAFAWVGALRRTVGRQTSVIADKVKRESVLNERQRIARELHDSLAQGLAGIALQLKGCRKLFEHGAEKINISNALSVMQQTLEYCSTESRNLIFDLRGGLLERMDLPAALAETLQPLADACGAELKIAVAGASRRLAMRTERNLLLVSKEAVTNAVHHANPEHIRVELDFGDENLNLIVEDDGCGFDVDQQVPTGHFGLRGMRERIKKLGGTFAVESQVGQGTRICATVSSHSEGDKS